MTWIQAVDREDADERLRKLLDRVAGADGQIDNILAAHTLRPHTLEGHMGLYKAVLHHFGNALPKAYLEAIGVYVSSLNACAYCVEHHAAGLAREVGDPKRSQDMVRALLVNRPAEAFGGRDLAGLRYAAMLTLRPADVGERDVDGLRDAGFDDGEILEINQVTAYFAYANRTVLGLGVTTAGEALGQAPRASDEPGDWSHR